MATKARAIFMTILLLSFAISSIGPATAQEETFRYFPETDHTVKGEFLKKYDSSSNPALIFGYPITEVFQPAGSNLQVQYFQKARFELHPDNPPDQRIVIYPLGKYWFEKDKPGEGEKLPENYPACRFFPKTKHQVCYAFLDFFDENGGQAQFGNPLSDIVKFRGRLVQYFEYARLEWHPERSSGLRVVLSNLGLFYFQAHENQELTLVRDKDAAPLLNNVVDLRVNAFVKSAVVSRTGSQTIYVIVQDQNLNAIADAQVLLIITLPSGQKRQVSSKLTNENGYTSFTFTLEEKSIGITTVEVVVNYSIMPQKSTWTTFRIWY